ncbi:hypothetical protein QFZ79_001409 [Arthrobacter sp. V4I6]|nr:MULTISPECIES: hypothetical protein [unclassified Arthrobacter]MDQ0823664.1 hypothetical protein [Arthrobacter sp. V1I7]MDQ0853298.1 hypothetical protein [Arthrobacter sp. V4I6]
MGAALVLGAFNSVDALIAGRYFGMRVCYLRDDDRVVETCRTTPPAAAS